MSDSARRQRQGSPGAIDDRLFRLMTKSVIDHAVIGIDLEGETLRAQRRMCCLDLYQRRGAPRESGNPIRATANVFNITSRKQAEDELKEALARELIREREARGKAERANRSKDEFITLISHGLRSPLNAILGWTRILRRGAREERLYDRGVEIQRAERACNRN
ncbi:MAG: hypothetical protein J2P21_01515 [Chloracidobacterium sp.]|nr:hypothetical protein [Chloracidobacterium sp.]